MMQKPDICIYHAYCPDGFTSAWAIWKKFGDSVDYRHGSYGAGMPTVDGKHVLLVDFSYKRAELLEIISKAATVTILDHHKTAFDDIGDLLTSGDMQGVFDMDKSGARLAWEWAFPGEPVPMLVQYVEDRDLWRWKFDDDTRAFCAALDMYPMEFANWDHVNDAVHDPNAYNDFMMKGRVLHRKHMKNCDHLIAATLHHIEIEGFRVPCCNVPHIYCSEVGNILALREDAPFSATFFVNKEGNHTFSLRSIDSKADVSEIALKFGGGGHRNASGFKMPRNKTFEVVE